MSHRPPLLSNASSVPHVFKRSAYCEADSIIELHLVKMASNNIPRNRYQGHALPPTSIFTEVQPSPHNGPHHPALRPLQSVQHASASTPSAILAAHVPLPASCPPQSVSHAPDPALPNAPASHHPLSPRQPCGSNSVPHASRTALIPPKAPPKHTHSTLKSCYHTLFTDWWLWEILAVLLSLSTFSTIIAILVIYDGSNVAQLPQGISLNAIISILSTISKASLIFSVSATLSQFKWLLFSGRTRQLEDLQLYDDASRGPLGSSLLLISEKGRLVCSRVDLRYLLTITKLLGVHRCLDHRLGPCS